MRGQKPHFARDPLMSRDDRFQRGAVGSLDQLDVQKVEPSKSGVIQLIEPGYSRRWLQGQGWSSTSRAWPPCSKSCSPSSGDFQYANAAGETSRSSVRTSSSPRSPTVSLRDSPLRRSRRNRRHASRRARKSVKCRVAIGIRRRKQRPRRLS